MTTLQKAASIADCLHTLFPTFLHPIGPVEKGENDTGKHNIQHSLAWWPPPSPHFSHLKLEEKTWIGKKWREGMTEPPFRIPSKHKLIEDIALHTWNWGGKQTRTYKQEQNVRNKKEESWQRKKQGTHRSQYRTTVQENMNHTHHSRKHQLPFLVLN